MKRRDRGCALSRTIIRRMARGEDHPTNEPMSNDSHGMRVVRFIRSIPDSCNENRMMMMTLPAMLSLAWLAWATPWGG